MVGYIFYYYFYFMGHIFLDALYFVRFLETLYPTKPELCYYTFWREYRQNRKPAERLCFKLPNPNPLACLERVAQR